MSLRNFVIYFTTDNKNETYLFDTLEYMTQCFKMLKMVSCDQLFCGEFLGFFSDFFNHFYLHFLGGDFFFFSLNFWDFFLLSFFRFQKNIEPFIVFSYTVRSHI